MSHLSILPTVLRETGCLHATLLSLGLHPARGGMLRGFAGEARAVELQVALPGGQAIGWERAPDGSLALVGDLQRISRSHQLQELLGTITRAYAARLALHEAAALLPEAAIELGS